MRGCGEHPGNRQRRPGILAVFPFSLFDYSQQSAGKTKPDGMCGMTMALYSVLLTLALVLSSPWWLLRMLTTDRYRQGLRERLGGVPARVLDEIHGRRVVWVHAVSVGEVLAASRLVQQLESALDAGGHRAAGKARVVVSTTTRTGQALARQRFGDSRVFCMPLDFAFAVRPYLRALHPEALILMENELWPRLLHECALRQTPVVVANARMSDRSFRRSTRRLLKPIWTRVMRQPRLWLAQSQEDALRLAKVGVDAASIQVTGNMKYDALAPRQSAMADRVRRIAAGRPIVVAGSTVEGSPAEEEPVIRAWAERVKGLTGALLVLAPRHPERFALVEAMLRPYRYARASALQPEGSSAAQARPPEQDGGSRQAQTAVPETHAEANPSDGLEIFLLDTIGDLAAVYAVADAAFVGGSLVRKGGHNPLEPAQFGVPVVMGGSFENFRDVVARMQEADAIRIVQDQDRLGAVLAELLADRQEAARIGERGRMVFAQQQGATLRAVQAILRVIAENRP